MSLRRAAPTALGKRRPSRSAQRTLPRLLLGSCVALSIAGCSLVRGPDAPPADAGGSSVDGSTLIHSGDPAAVAVPARAERIASLAASFVGSPYRYGGATPAGFDCSGLVLYVHGLAGLTVPRTAAGQMLGSRRVAREALRRGDLVFFASAGAGRAIDHVGIYLGDGEFVHAPRTGRAVGRDRLTTEWFAQRFVAGGRFWNAEEQPQGRP